MPFPFGALAGWVAAGHIAFDQRTAQRFGDRRKLCREALSALAERQFGKPGQLGTCLHLNASISRNLGPDASANLLESESPPINLI